MSGHSINEIDFEHWVTLASTDPQKFEQLRQDKISAIIERTTGHRKQRLQGLQWRIDTIRKQHQNSAATACVAISELMWETFEQLSGLLQAQVDGHETVQAQQEHVNIIPFPTK